MNTESNPPQPFGPSDAFHAPAARDERINILIVDDEPKNLTVLDTVLNHPDYRLVRAESADQALLALVVEEFALLILDIRMPGMTGFELAQMIKERKKTARVPIIFLTAYYNQDQHVLEGYETGAVDYLHKPVNPAILRSKVAIFAELHRKSREIAMANRALLAEVTERRRAEEQLRELNETLEQRVVERTQALHEADSRKDEFLATLAHELRNPLAPVRNAVQVLQMQGTASPELQFARDIIDRQVRQMSRLIDDLMNVSRINEGKIELKRERVSLATVIQGAVETSRSLIDECGHALTVALPSEPIILDADLTRLTQVFLNLLNNAAKFSEKGGRIDLKAERQGNEVVVSVTDTGIGIPADKLTSVFEMFSQVEGALTRSQGGLGIGLCLVKRLVEMHGGSIEAHSDGPGKGSEFVVRLPVVVEQSDSPATPGDDAESPLPSSELQILVVDDNRDAANSLAMLLDMMGNTVRVALDGAEAVDAAREFRPDVVLLDIGMPKMNGYDVARTIRQQEWGQNMVLIAMTGWGQDENKQKSQEAGFNRHMVKPVAPSSLMRLLAELQIESSHGAASEATTHPRHAIHGD
jgi:signal transduction histidine kinase